MNTKTKISTTGGSALESQLSFIQSCKNRRPGLVEHPVGQAVDIHTPGSLLSTAAPEFCLKLVWAQFSLATSHSPREEPIG
jgi:hypothetical protein